MKKNNNKGFTLAELLIVVAIIAVLVAIAIPVFTAPLEKSREATDIANIRSGYAEVMTQYLADGNTSASATGTVKQQVNGWITDDGSVFLYTRVDGVESSVPIGALTKGGTWKVTLTEDASGSVTVTAGAGS